MSYVSKRFRTFRKPIRRKYAQGGFIPTPSTYTLAKDRPEIVITMPKFDAALAGKTIVDILRKRPL
jgi:hypothetical protein